MTCPTCGMQLGHCRHTTEGQVTHVRLTELGRQLFHGDLSAAIAALGYPNMREVTPVPLFRADLSTAAVGSKAPAIGGGHWYRAEYGWKWNGPDGCGSTFPRPGGDWDGRLIAPAEDSAPTRPQPVDAPPARSSVSSAAGGAVGKRNNQLYDPKCRELAEYFAAGHDPALTDEQIDELSQDFQDAAESYLRSLESEGQS